VSDLAEIAQHHGEELYALGRFDDARAAFQRSREVLDSLVVLDASYNVILRLSRTLSWLGRAQRKAGKGIEAIRSYERAIALWRTLLRFPHAPDAHEWLLHRLAACLLGLSKVHYLHGRKQKAATYLQEAHDLIGGLSPK
ncbi:MAG: tetratricopeptide repeat protein, partial [Bdellovibrionales bacterium]|nr:tetratricopeptide repeat protein [Bdellovibrionales bacterium]